MASLCKISPTFVSANLAASKTGPVRRSKLGKAALARRAPMVTRAAAAPSTAFDNYEFNPIRESQVSREMTSR